MQLRNEQVVHPVFGSGTIRAVEDQVLLVEFATHGQKKFMYPQAFAQHLRAAKDELQAQLAAAANAQLAAQQAVLTEQRQQELALKQEAHDRAKQSMQKKRRSSKVGTAKVKKAAAELAPAASDA